MCKCTLYVKSISYYNFVDRFLAYPYHGEYILGCRYCMSKFESSQKDESRAQSTDSSKAYRNPSAYNS